jgi:hypothetical protein
MIKCDFPPAFGSLSGMAGRGCTAMTIFLRQIARHSQGEMIHI